MKARMHFDTLTYANKLKAAGMEPRLAEVQALALVEAFDEGLATKADVSQTRTELKTDITQTRTELKAEIAELRGELKADIAQARLEAKANSSQLKSELIQWMVGLFITNLTLVGGFIAFSQFLNHSH